MDHDSTALPPHLRRSLDAFAAAFEKAPNTFLDAFRQVAEEHSARTARDVGEEVLAALFGETAAPETADTSSEPVSASPAPAESEIDWTETDAAIARRSTEQPASPSPDDGGATTSEERAFLAALNPKENP